MSSSLIAGVQRFQRIVYPKAKAKIAHGMVRIHDEKQHKFIPVSSDRPVTSRAAG
jgi:hypothetical protein